MTAYARIITTARNDQFPRITLGYAVDGSSLTVPVSAGHVVCRDCRGTGEISYWDGNPSSRTTYDRCETCRGEGQVQS